MLPPSTGFIMLPEEKGKGKVKSEPESKNCESSISSHQGTVKVELEDGTSRDVELSSLIDIAGIKRRRLRPERATVED